MSDPLGWEALTQQEAEQDARTRDLAECEQDKSYIWHRLVTRRRERDETLRERDMLAEQLAVAVRERDQARDALRQAHHFVDGAIEEQGETDDDLLALPGTMWARLLSARDVALAALAGGEEAVEEDAGAGA